MVSQCDEVVVSVLTVLAVAVTVVILCVVCRERYRVDPVGCRGIASSSVCVLVSTIVGSGNAVVLLVSNGVVSGSDSGGL